MKPLYSDSDFKNATYSTQLPLQCNICHNTFYKIKGYITRVLKTKSKQTATYCSKPCQTLGQNKHKQVVCKNCNKNFSIKLSKVKRSKSGNNFCSSSCAATYNNKHKSTGIRRSKLECWLEKQLTNIYPNIEFQFNKKDAIDSELDIYIPSLNIAFELNGIFHYEPIYGINKLNKIQNNDKSKSKACYDAKIDLCIIDTSDLKYFKPANTQKYINIITDIINQRT